MNIVKQAAKERLQLEQQLAHSKSREVRLVSPAFLPRALRFLLRVFHVLACRFSCTVRSCVSCTVLVFPVLFGLVFPALFSSFLYCTVLCFLHCSRLSCTVRSCGFLYRSHLSCTVRSCVSCTVLVFPVLYGLVVFVPFSPFLYCTVLCFLYCSLLSCTVRSCVSCTLLCRVQFFYLSFVNCSRLLFLRNCMLVGNTLLDVFGLNSIAC